jgi:hypothetical protein
VIKHIIVSEDTINKFRRFQKVWYLGWLTAALIFGYSAYLYGQVAAHKEATKELIDLRLQVQYIQEQQAQAGTALVANWEEQRQERELLVSWAQYVKERLELIRSNKINYMANK